MIRSMNGKKINEDGDKTWRGHMRGWNDLAARPHAGDNMAAVEASRRARINPCFFVAITPLTDVIGIRMLTCEHLRLKENFRYRWTLGRLL